MLKYSDRITKLTDGQKIRILAELGELSGKDMKNFGIPSMKAGNIKDYGRDRYPHTTSISHAWNAGLWNRVASAKIGEMAEDGVHFVIAPGAKIKLSPYRKETTEDPYLASVLSGSYMRAATDAEIPVGAAGYYITESEALWMDAEPNHRILNEYVVRPYLNAGEMAPTSGIMTDLRLPSKAYGEVCDELWRMIVGQTEFLVCEQANDDTTVPLITKGVLCLHASSNALISALTQYRKLMKRLEEGGDVTLLQIEEAIACGEAISDELLDAAVDRALDFLFRCHEAPKPMSYSEEESDALALQATRESVVLLKNENALLPLSKQARITVLDAFCSSEQGSTLGEQCQKQLAACGWESVCTERFYAPDEASLENGVNHVIASCRDADVTILLLGSGYEAEKRMYQSEKLTLPPAQLYLADRVSKEARRVVAVILSEHATDVAFTRRFESVIYAPLPIKHSARALVEILSGRYNPTGRLAYTLYAGTEPSLQKGASYLRDCGMKSGPFIGYRYYDSADLRVGYPFGYGLSYTEFLYYDLSVTEKEISFTVQNCTRVTGSEVAQVYIGMENSARLRPKKELCGFAKIELGPLERRRITIPTRLPCVYDGEAFVAEKGTYSVYVGASVSDIRLQGSICAGERTLEPEEERLSDYLQSHSNILNDNYTLEANYSVMKKGITNIVAGVISLALAISLAVFNITTDASSMALGVIAGILAVGSILFFIVEMVERSRLHAAERKKIQEANQAYFEEAEQIPVLSTEKMFAEAFDHEEEETEVPTHALEVESDFDDSEFVDPQMKLNDALQEFCRFATERGFKIGRGVVENLFASLAVSKLLIVNGLSAEEYNAFVLLLSEYFGCPVCMDNTSNPALTHHDADGVATQNNMRKAIVVAAEDASKIQIAALDDVTAENITSWTSPLMRYFRSPRRRNTVITVDEQGAKQGYYLGTNLWMLVRLSEYDAVDMLPMEIVKCAAIVNMTFTKCQMSEDHIAAHGFSSYQVEYMLGRIAGKYDVSEEIWKKIDKIEKYAKQYADYSIGNKLWLSLEKQMECLLACGLEQDEAVDVALATRVLPSVSVALKDRLSNEDKTMLQTVEFVFGADHVEYAKAYVDSLTVKKREIEPEPVAVETLVEKTAVEEATAEEATAEEAAAEEAPVEEAPAEEAPAEEAPAEEAPAEEAPAEEAPVEEAPAEEAPVEEAAAEEAAVEEEANDAEEEKTE